MPSDPRDYKLTLTNQPADPAPANGENPVRPFLSVYFACCHVYCRLYRDPQADRYDGACPRCGKRVRFLVGADGTPSRSFRVE